MGSKTTVQSNEPWKPAQASILKGLDATNTVFDQNQPGLQDTSAQLKAGFNALAPQAFGPNPLQDQTESALSDTIGGKYLQSNPYLDGIIKTTNDGITNTVNSQFETGGRYGSAGHAGILAQKIGDADNSLQYQNYADERARQQQAIGMSSGVQAGRYAGVSPLLALAQGSASIPYTGIDALNGNVKTASGGYGTSTSTTNDPMGAVTGILGAGATAAAGIWSDVRLKDITDGVGTTPDGLGLFNYTYKGDPSNTPQTGVIAQQVAQLRPDALGPTAPDGTMSVNYAKLGLPDPTTMAAQFNPDAKKTPYDSVPIGAISDDPRTGGIAGMIAPAGSAPDPITPQTLPTVYNNSGNVDRSAGGILGRILSPDASTTAGKLGLLGQALMSANGSPLQSLGNGLTKTQADQAASAKAATDDAYKQAQIAAETRTANKPTLTTLGNDLYSTPADGGAPVKIASGSPKQAETPFGFKIDPATGNPVALPGWMTPADKAKADAEKSDASAAAAEDRQAKQFAHSDAMQARSLAAIAARTGSGATSAPLPGATVDYMAQRYLVDGTLPQLGMGKASAGMKSQIINRAVELAASQGQTGADGVAAKAGYAGQVAGQRALGTRAAQINLAAEEASQTFPLARQASANIARTGFVPFTQVEQMVQQGNNNPQLAAFNAANQAVITTYSRAVSPTGQPTVSGTEHARSLISTAMNPQAYNAVLDQMQKEIAVAQNSVANTRAKMSSEMTGRQPAANNNAPVKIMGDADYARLQSGQHFVGPDGQVRVKR